MRGESVSNKKGVRHAHQGTHAYNASAIYEWLGGSRGRGEYSGRMSESSYQAVPWDGEGPIC